MRTYLSNGFTLLEMLVAISIFSLIGVGSYTLLATVIDAGETADHQSAQLEQVQKTLTFLRQDLSQIKAKKVPGVDGKPVLPLQMEGNAYSISFIRGGRTNPLGLQRSDLLAVSYTFEYEETDNTGSLVRYTQSLNDNEVSHIRQVLVRHIENFTVRYMGDNREWTGTWPVSSDVTRPERGPHSTFSLPLAVEFVVSHGTYGEMRYVIEIPRGLPELPGADNREI